LSVPQVRKTLENLPGCQLINGYGPTENTTFTCCHRITLPLPDGRSIPIGRAIANTQVYVLDEQLQPVPIGVPGELCIAGDGLARGYLNAPELTAEKFVANPFSTKPDARLYRTGDVARWLADGTIEFIGRLDHQVKIRGFRVELGEIESTLSRHPAVRACVVTAHAGVADGKELAAYFVSDAPTPPTAGELSEHLRQSLPDYMIPAAFVPLVSLPLNANGKVNRRALPSPDRTTVATTRRFIAPRDELETALTKIWEEVLGIQPLGVEDHFFDLGGHSLMAVRLIARIEKTIGRRLPVAAIFQSPTVAQLAGVLRAEKPAATGSSLVEIQPNGSKPPLFFVHGVGGGMFWGYTNLSRHLGLDQPVFAFNSRGVNGQEEFASIEEMAAQYVADLRAFRSHGPYCLGGYCFGGNVAYEMARQLEAQGEDVALLALLNCAPPNTGYTRISWTPAWMLKFLRNLCYLAGCFVHWSKQQRRDFVRWRARRLGQILRRLLRPGRAGQAALDAEELVDLSAQPGAERKLWEAHINALLKYRPQPYAGRVTLLRMGGHQLLCSFDPQYGWGELARGGVTVRVIPGAHENILEEPHVEVVAEELKRCQRESLAAGSETKTL
ncbi:MAG TPA: alpha/beta fold hydrolase, partial [Verrucomicrobiae bacterium]|jgi:thioesterase domain-containing protein/acyl carrier protein